MKVYEGNKGIVREAVVTVVVRKVKEEKVV